MSSKEGIVKILFQQNRKVVPRGSGTPFNSLLNDHLWGEVPRRYVGDIGNQVESKYNIVPNSAADGASGSRIR
jgi:hypothetical protein